MFNTMTRQETVEELKRLGHNVRLEGSTIMFLLDDPKDFNLKTQKKNKEILMSVGYLASYGMRVVKKKGDGVDAIDSK